MESIGGEDPYLGQVYAKAMVKAHKYANNLKQLVEEKLISEEIIDEAVLRILKLKNKLGLFENPYKNLDNEMEEKTLLNKENLKKARELTSKTFVLLKNKNEVLPLNKGKKIALIGPYADNIAILGSWSMSNLL